MPSLGDNDPRFTAPLEDGSETPYRSVVEPGQGDGEDAEAHETHEDRRWLQLARDAYRSSENWFDSSQRVVFERALANFRSVHPPGSKYHSDAYLKKSKLFRPKTRAAIRKAEAGHAVAFFSTHDVVHCTPVNETDPRQVLGAEVHNSLINMRMNDPQLHWYQTLIGGCQDAQAVGVVISKEYWNYESREQDFDNVWEEDDGEGGTRTVYDQSSEQVVLRDHPAVMLIPVENFRFDPACDWRDPVNSSPYIIELQGTYVHEVIDRVKTGEYFDWIDATTMHSALKQDWDSIRKQREGQRVDKFDSDTYIPEYRTVWIHHNIVRRNGQDWVYDTLGVEILLNEPRPIEAVYPHSETRDRPYSMGVAIIETHKNYPSSVPQLLEDLQEEANDIANLRLDNVKHAINKRWLVRKGRGVDIRALVRNVSSSVIMVSDPLADVKEIQTRDVTQSAYQEQDRIDHDIDSIVGGYDPGAAAKGSRSEQTLGGSNIADSASNMMQEYMIRTLSETWVEKVMRHLVKMESIYESDENILRVVASSNKATLEEVMAALGEVVNVNVNVGFNSTNPQKRIEKLSLGLATVANFAPEMMQGADRAEIIKEVFGALGHKDGSRFFPMLNQQDVDPQIQALQTQIQQLTEIVEGKQIEQQTRIQVAQISVEGAMAIQQIKAQVEVMKFQATGDFDAFVMQMKNRLEEFDRMLAQEKTDIEKKELWLQREALSHEIQMANREYELAMRSDDREERTIKTDGAFDLPGNDKAGVISRGNYDLIPQNIM